MNKGNKKKIVDYSNESDEEVSDLTNPMTKKKAKSKKASEEKEATSLQKAE